MPGLGYELCTMVLVSLVQSGKFASAIAEDHFLYSLMRIATSAPGWLWKQCRNAVSGSVRPNIRAGTTDRTAGETGKGGGLKSQRMWAKKWREMGACLIYSRSSGTSSQ